jgi:hypothetical protein
MNLASGSRFVTVFVRVYTLPVKDVEGVSSLLAPDKLFFIRNNLATGASVNAEELLVMV